MSPIPFDQLPSTLRVPFVAAEFDASQAAQGPALLQYEALIVGQKLSAGAWTANAYYRVTREDEVVAGAGRGSMLHRQWLAWRKNNTSTPVWMGVVADDGTGVAATGTITVTGPATAAGTIVLYLGGERVTVGVSASDSDSTIATAIAAAINAATALPVTASPSSGVVTVTFRHKGVAGNDYDMRDSFRTGEALPAGVALAYVQLASGATNPSLTNLLAALGDKWFHIWTHPYTDATDLTALETELLSRAAANRMIDGVATTGGWGSYSTLTTLGASRNSQFSGIFAQPGTGTLTPTMEFAAAVAAVIALAAQADPGRPFQTLQVQGVLAPADVDLFTQDERDGLLHEGIATTVAGPGGGVFIDRAITTYQKTPGGAPDEAYLDYNVPVTLMYLRYAWRVRIATRYPRHKLADDGTRFGPGQPVMTPKLGRAEAVAWFEDMQELGLVENLDQFKRDLLVERDVSDRNRMNWLLPPDLINQLIGRAAKIQFR